MKELDLKTLKEKAKTLIKEIYDEEEDQRKKKLFEAIELNNREGVKNLVRVKDLINTCGKARKSLESIDENEKKQIKTYEVYFKWEKDGITILSEIGKKVKRLLYKL